MEINISQIDEYDGLAVEHLFPQGELDLEDDESRLVGTPALHLQATREGEEVLLRGSLEASVEVDCDRCLRVFSIVVNQSFALLYLPANKARKAHEEHELKDDDLSISSYQGLSINVDELVREQIHLSLPMTRLCKEDCRGLCLQCRANLNEGQCSCQIEQFDLRWTALKELKNN
jgi:uncharacterized protein